MYAEKMPKDNFQRVKIVLDIVEAFWRICYHISRMEKYFCAIRIKDRIKKVN
jgi:hypothetical protein